MNGMRITRWNWRAPLLLAAAFAAGAGRAAGDEPDAQAPTVADRDRAFRIAFRFSNDRLFDEAILCGAEGDRDRPSPAQEA